MPTSRSESTTPPPGNLTAPSSSSSPEETSVLTEATSEVAVVALAIAIAIDHNIIPVRNKRTNGLF